MSAAIAVPDPIIREIAADHLGRVDAITAVVTPHAAAGANADTALLTIAGCGREAVFFVKRLHPGLDEARVHRALRGSGAPIPGFIAAFRDEAGREVLILERLAHPRLTGGDEADFAALLDALAAFNAVPAERLPRPAAGRLSAWCDAWVEVWSRCASGGWGPELAGMAARHRGRQPLWRGAAARIEARLEALPAMTTHHDPAYGNAGRRTADGAVVLFDLHYVDAFPRLRDLALCLGGFHQPWPDAGGRRPWIERYCAALARRGGPVIDPEQAEEEVRLHLAAQAMWMDARTIAQAEAAWARDPGGFASSWGAWLQRSWAAVEAWISANATGG